VVLRKPIPVLVLVAVSVLAVVGASFYYVSRNGPPGSDHSQCSDPDSISSHVYNPHRLTIVKSCITASGVVDTSPRRLTTTTMCSPPRRGGCGWIR